MTNMNKQLFFVTACLCVASSGAVAQSADSTAPAPVAPALTLTGYVEAYYVHDFTAPKTAQERPAFLYNHKRNRELNINLAFVKLAYTTDRVGVIWPFRWVLMRSTTMPPSSPC